MDREPPRSADWSTRDLVDRCCQHDARAGEEFVHRYNGVVSGYVVRAVRMIGLRTPNERETMCDLVQEVYARLLLHDCRVLKAWRGETEESLRAYLAKITHTMTVDKARREAAKKRKGIHVSIDATEPETGRSIADELPASPATSPDQLMAERLASEKLQAQLAEVLSGPNAARDARIFELHVLEGRTASEIASMPEFDMQVSTVESVIRRTRERLKNHLENPDNRSG